jgi:outer membrane protein assembly factor BamE (lipoprotein component of BamABCDE complex)
VRTGSRRLALTLALGLLLPALAACSEEVDVRGNLPDAKTIASIKPGQSTRAQVESTLGTPSSVATFDKETWYYIGGRVKTVSFFKPELLERRVIAVRFDKSGVVHDIHQLDAADGKSVALVERETPTKGKELTVLQQLIGNIGRFGGQTSNPEADQNTGPTPTYPGSYPGR